MQPDFGTADPREVDDWKPAGEQAHGVRVL
jgi:hypothetical protein